MGKISIIFKYFLVQIISFFIKPNKNYWLFSSSFNNYFNYNSKYLFEYTLKNNPEIESKYVINNDLKRNELIQKYGDHFIETKTLSGMVYALKAGVWFTSAGLPIYILFSRKNRIIINLWHGIPFKKIGLMENNFNKVKKMYFKKVFSDNYYAIMTTSSNLIGIMSKSFDVSKNKIKVLGQPRNDLLKIPINKGSWLKKNFPIYTRSSKLVLYAPTYREFGVSELFPFNDLKFSDLIEFLIKENIVLFIRMHQSEANQNFFKNIEANQRIHFINNDLVEDIMEIIEVFDLLITDYSSIYIDHLLLQKPQLFIPYDLKEYTKKRGLNFDYTRFTPGPKVNCFTEFQLEIKRLLSDSNYYKEERYLLNNYFNQIKSNSCEKIVSYTKESL